jgi:hypothetical protein
MVSTRRSNNKGKRQRIRIVTLRRTSLPPRHQRDIRPISAGLKPVPAPSAVDVTPLRAPVCPGIPEGDYDSAVQACSLSGIQLLSVNTLTTGASSGDCQFDAIAKALCLPNVTYRSVRQKVAQSLRRGVHFSDDELAIILAANPDHYEAHLGPTPSNLTVPQVRGRIADAVETSGDTFWGDNMTLLIAARVYGLWILVSRYRGSDYACGVYEVVPDPKPRHKGIVLFYDQDRHYRLGVATAESLRFPHFNLKAKAQAEIFVRMRDAWTARR